MRKRRRIKVDPAMDWDISVRAGAVQISLQIPGQDKPVEFALTPEDAYELHSDIGRGYDQVTGIA